MLLYLVCIYRYVSVLYLVYRFMCDIRYVFRVFMRDILRICLCLSVVLLYFMYMLLCLCVGPQSINVYILIYLSVDLY